MNRDDEPPGADLGPRFGIDGQLTDVRPLGRGHIHRTFLATYRAPGGVEERWVHQRLNTSVFADLDLLMDNMARVTAHLGARAGDARRAVRLRPAADGRPVAFDEAGAPWRTLHFIDGARTYARFDGPGPASDGAAAAARLVADLADLDPPPPEVIPGFHDVPARLGALERAQRADTANRAAACRPEVTAVLDHAGLARQVAEARVDGRLPERTVHNDAKTENLLFDEATGDALCLVDLDTVGPGTVLFDLGDLVRSGATAVPEDRSPDQLTVDAEIVAALLDGYASAGAGFLTGAEVAFLPLAGPLMALESAARFLTDHLQGDVYFRIEGPGHNLRRARNQLRVLELLLAG
ncbi:MAG TPA: phosphotransferase [Acidimicrobiales bacterium]|nr:phosphotransferase [Acidimicrobiales bacterium]